MTPPRTPRSDAGDDVPPEAPAGDTATSSGAETGSAGDASDVPAGSVTPASPAPMVDDVAEELDVIEPRTYTVPQAMHLQAAGSHGLVELELAAGEYTTADLDEIELLESIGVAHGHLERTEV